MKIFTTRICKICGRKTKQLYNHLLTEHAIQSNNVNEFSAQIIHFPGVKYSLGRFNGLPAELFLLNNGKILLHFKRKDTNVVKPYKFDGLYNRYNNELLRLKSLDISAIFCDKITDESYTVSQIKFQNLVPTKALSKSLRFKSPNQRYANDHERKFVSLLENDKYTDWYYFQPIRLSAAGTNHRCHTFFCDFLVKRHGIIHFVELKGNKYQAVCGHKTGRKITSRPFPSIPFLTVYTDHYRVLDKIMSNRRYSYLTHDANYFSQLMKV